MHNTWFQICRTLVGSRLFTTQDSVDNVLLCGENGGGSFSEKAKEVTSTGTVSDAIDGANVHTSAPTVCAPDWRASSASSRKTWAHAKLAIVVAGKWWTAGGEQQEECQQKNWQLHFSVVNTVDDVYKWNESHYGQTRNFTQTELTGPYKKTERSEGRPD